MDEVTNLMKKHLTVTYKPYGHSESISQIALHVLSVNFFWGLLGIVHSIYKH